MTVFPYLRLGPAGSNIFLASEVEEITHDFLNLDDNLRDIIA
jgi:hypothetical protein